MGSGKVLTTDDGPKSSTSWMGSGSVGNPGKVSSIEATGIPSIFKNVPFVNEFSIFLLWARAEFDELNPSWVDSICFLKLNGIEGQRGHFWNVGCFCPLHDFICTFKLPFFEKLALHQAWLHKVHLNGFFPSWTASMYVLDQASKPDIT